LITTGWNEHQVFDQMALIMVTIGHVQVEPIDFETKAIEDKR
jgi:hypothetical protein